MNPNHHPTPPFTAVLVRPIQSSPLAAATALPVCAATGRLPLSLLRRYFPAATGLVFEGPLGLTAVPSKISSSLEGQLIFLLPEPSFDYLVISDPTSPEMAGNQKEQNNNMLVGIKTMDSSKMKDPNIVTDKSKEEMLALREELAALRKEFDELQTPQMVRDEMKLTEVREELDLLKGLQSEVRTLAGKVKELEKYLQGGVKCDVPGLERPDSDEVNTLKANTGGSRGEKGKKGSDCEVLEEDKAKNCTASTRPLEVTREVEAKSDVNNNIEDDQAKYSTESKNKEDTKEMEKTGVDPSVEAAVLSKKGVEVQAKANTASTREVEKIEVGAFVETSVPTEKKVTTGPVVLNFVSVKPKMVKKKSK